MSISKFWKEAVAYRLGGGHAADHAALGTPSYSTDSAGNTVQLLPNNAPFYPISAPPVSCVIIGDSITGYAFAATSVASGLTATIGTKNAQLIVSNNFLGVGQSFTISSVNQIEFNGCWKVASLSTTTTLNDTISFTINSNATVATATGTINFAKGNTYSQFGYWQYLNGLKLKMANMAGLPGDCTVLGVNPLSPGVLQRLPYDVFPYNPQVCILMIGINDLGTTGVTGQATAANIITISNAILARGSKLVLCSINPVGLAGTIPAFVYGSAATTTLKITAANALLRAYSEVTPGVVFADTYAAMVDYSSVKGYAITSMLSDGLHPSAIGASTMASVITTALLSLGVQGVVSLTSGSSVRGINLNSSSNDTILQNSLSTNVAGNPLMTGSGGVASGAGITQTVIPASWEVQTSGGGGQTAISNTVLRTMAADGDLLGYNWVVNAAGAASGDLVRCYTNAGVSGIPITGIWLYGDLDLGISNTAGLVNYIQLNTYASTSGGAVQSVGMQQVGSFGPLVNFRGAVRMPPVWVPAAATWNYIQCGVFISFGGVGSTTIQMGRMQLRWSATKPY